MENSLLSFNHVAHSFGESQVLHGVNLEIKPGMVVGLLGRNGAGKSTLLRTAVGLVAPTQGNISVFGECASQLSLQNKAKIGFVAQQTTGYEGFTVAQALGMHSSFYDTWDSTLEAAWMTRFQLHPEAKVNQLSLGQRQSLALIMAMAYRPQLLILDEPVASLDPIARRQFMHDVFELTLESDTGVLFSTHITSDVERIASHVAILQEGKICLFAEIDELKSNLRQLHFANPQPDLSAYTVVCQQPTKAIISDYQGLDIDGVKRMNCLSLEELFVEINP